jgi:hypothetical protein
LSPDTDFAPRGNVTGINYLESFREYKKILSSDPLDPTYQRIFTIFNTSLFGVTATPRADFVLDTGDYDAELREFNERLAAEKSGDNETTDLPPPSPPAPSSPPRSQISVSVTSNVSLVTTAVNVVTSNIALVPTDETAVETLPPAPKVTKPPTKKKAAWGSSTITGPPGHDAEPVAPTKKNPARKAKTTSTEPPTRSTRSRS